MSNHDDFIDEYIEYRIFEDSMKKSSGGGKPPKRNAGCSGCCSCLIIIVLVILAVSGITTVRSVTNTTRLNLHTLFTFSVLYRNGANYQQTIVFCLSLDYNVIRKITLIMMEHKNEKGLSQHESAERCTLPVPRYPDGSQATAMSFNYSSLLVKFPQS